jgi:hypothetical protein
LGLFGFLSEETPAQSRRKAGTIALPKSERVKPRKITVND